MLGTENHVGCKSLRYYKHHAFYTGLFAASEIIKYKEIIMGLLSTFNPRQRHSQRQAANLLDIANRLLRTPGLTYKSQLDIIEGYTELAQRYEFEPEIKNWVRKNAKESQ